MKKSLVECPPSRDFFIFTPLCQSLIYMIYLQLLLAYAPILARLPKGTFSSP